jgi:hypothetical protein
VESETSLRHLSNRFLLRPFLNHDSVYGTHGSRSVCPVLGSAQVRARAWGL